MGNTSGRENSASDGSRRNYNTDYEGLKAKGYSKRDINLFPSETEPLIDERAREAAKRESEENRRLEEERKKRAEK